MAASKMTREGLGTSNGFNESLEDDLYNFGDPKVISVELCPGKYLSLREPMISELAEIEKVSAKSSSEADTLAQTICILHAPEPGVRRITLKEAKRLTAGHLKLLNDPVAELLGIKKEKSENGDEKEES